jgi:hypothetical protein
MIQKLAAELKPHPMVRALNTDFTARLRLGSNALRALRKIWDVIFNRSAHDDKFEGVAARLGTSSVVFFISSS